MTSSLDHRRDVRSEDVFAQNIEDYTEREQRWAEALRIDLVERGLRCRTGDTGVDNSGGLIRGKIGHCNPDKIFRFPHGWKLVEIKTIPEYLYQFMTFKVRSFASCIKNEAVVLVPKLNV